MLNERMQRWRRSMRMLLFAAVIGAMTPIADADAADVAVQVVLGDLNQPCAVAIRPGGTADRYEVFVADSGAGRILRWATQSPKQSDDVVTGFKAQAAADPFRQNGPRAIYFLDPGLLVVGTTRDKDGDLLRTYELPDGETTLEANATTDAGATSTAIDDDACTAITRSRANEFVRDLLFVSIRDASGGERLMQARVQAGVIGSPKPFGTKDATTKVKVEPRVLATSNTGRLVVADAGGQLSFFNPIDGMLELMMPTELKQPISLAYNPTTASLYAADFAGGIYRIDDAGWPGHPECRTVKVADVRRPTSLAFAPDGSLYVVTYGSGDADGTLSVISGEL
jgi:DNA-binding beta-propeller fold protein YncE